MFIRRNKKKEPRSHNRREASTQLRAGEFCERTRSGFEQSGIGSLFASTEHCLGRKTHPTKRFSRPAINDRDIVKSSFASSSPQFSSLPLHLPSSPCLKASPRHDGSQISSFTAPIHQPTPGLHASVFDTYLEHAYASVHHAASIPCVPAAYSSPAAASSQSIPCPSLLHGPAVPAGSVEVSRIYSRCLRVFRGSYHASHHRG